MKIAVVGSGVSGLAAAHRLRQHARVTLFEADSRFGGHANTVDVTLAGQDGKPVCFGVDTGFLVFNERTYPGLIALFKELAIPTASSDMSFSVQVPRAGLEWSGSNLASVFAQYRNLVRPKFWRMLQDLLRFNRICTDLALSGKDAQLHQPLREFLADHRFSAAFQEWYLLPMLGCIWSCPAKQMLNFPVATMIRFCHNHGLLQVSDRPRWFTVAGGARQYVNRIVAGLDARLNSPVLGIERSAAGITVHTQGQVEQFDQVILAVHSDQALRLLAQPSAQEISVLGAIGYQENRAVLHTDTSLMPRRKTAWAAWNYERAADAAQDSSAVCLHYWLNQLQPLPFSQDLMVSLNPIRPIEATKVLAEFSYAHPVFDQAALEAQSKVESLQGKQGTWFCGAWAGYGFHEDGLQSGYRVAEAVCKLGR